MLTVKKLKEILENYDDDLIIRVGYHTSEWSYKERDMALEDVVDSKLGWESKLIFIPLDYITNDWNN